MGCGVWSVSAGVGVGCEVGSAGELVWVWDEECWGGGWGGSAGVGGWDAGVGGGM